MTDKKCPFHDKPYDGSRRFGDGTERRWNSSLDGSNQKHILPCTCGKGYKDYS